MSNISVNETLMLSTNSEIESATYWENVSSYSLTVLTASTQHHIFNELLLFIKNAFVCWFMKQTLSRNQLFSYSYDVLLLVIGFHSVCKRDLDICGLSFVWICYMQAIRLFWPYVWINCLISCVVMLNLSANAPDYLSLLAFTVNILFVYSLLCEIATRRRYHSLRMLNGLMVAFGLAKNFEVLHSAPGPDMDEPNFILMLLVPMIPLAVLSEKPTHRSVFATMVFIYCEYKKITLHGVTR